MSEEEKQSPEAVEDGPQSEFTALYMHHRALDGPVTVCLLVDVDGLVAARGVAVCSAETEVQRTIRRASGLPKKHGNQFRKSIGREMAYDRALKAAQSSLHSEPISRRKPSTNLRMLQNSYPVQFRWLSFYLPELTPFEESVFDRFMKRLEKKSQ